VHIRETPSTDDGAWVIEEQHLGSRLYSVNGDVARDLGPPYTRAINISPRDSGLEDAESKTMRPWADPFMEAETALERTRESNLVAATDNLANRSWKYGVGLVINATCSLEDDPYPVHSASSCFRDQRYLASAPANQP